MQSAVFNKLQSPPRTAIEVFEMLPEGTMAEVINNVLYMSPAPTYEHQKMLATLFKAITYYVDEKNLGDCVFAPVLQPILLPKTSRARARSPIPNLFLLHHLCEAGTD